MLLTVDKESPMNWNERGDGLYRNSFAPRLSLIDFKNRLLLYHPCVWRRTIVEPATGESNSDAPDVNGISFAPCVKVRLTKGP